MYLKQKKQGTWQRGICQRSRSWGGGRRALVGWRRVRKRANKGIEPENARWDRARNGGGSAWRGPCAGSVVQEVRTPTDGGGCCNGAAMVLQMKRAGKCTAGPCTERRGLVRSWPCMVSAAHGARIQREGETCSDGTKHETSGNIRAGAVSGTGAGKCSSGEARRKGHTRKGFVNGGRS